MHRFTSIFMKICTAPQPPEGEQTISNAKTPPLGAGGLLSWQEKLEWE